MKNSTRLITSGCSCTQYCWPTWADYLGKHFNEYINVGLAGADNAVIARNVMEVASAGDIVVIHWSGFDRFNSFYDNRVQDTKMIGHRLTQQWSGLNDTQKGGWWHHGAIGSRSFLADFYHRIERFRTTLDYVKMVEMHSIQHGYQVFNFSTFEWFLAESESVVDPRLVAMHKHSKFQHFYLDNNLEKIRKQTAPIITTHKYNPTGDSHPTPLVQWKWLHDYVAPELKITIDTALEDQVKYDQARVLAGDVD